MPPFLNCQADEIIDDIDEIFVEVDEILDETLLDFQDLKVHDLKEAGLELATETKENIVNFATNLYRTFKPEEGVVNYEKDRPVLYELIENNLWEHVMNRLESHPEEASLTIERYHKSNPNKLAWKMLPIHSVCYPIITQGSKDGDIIRCGIRGPVEIVKKLIEIYPDGATVQDDLGMLPLHHVCRNGGNIHAITTILDAYEEGINARDKKGRTPIELTRTSRAYNKSFVLHFLSRVEQSTREEANVE